METIDIDLNDFSRDALISFIYLSCSRQEPVDKVLVYLLECYVAEHFAKEDKTKEVITE